MNTEKMHIEPNTVQETLVIPLWGRKYCSEIYPEIYNDPMAAQIMEKLDYDFSALEEKKHKVGFRFGYLEAAARYTDLGIEVRNYCKEHPYSAISTFSEENILEDKEMLEDIVYVAINDVINQVKKEKEKKLGKYTNGLGGIL